LKDQYATLGRTKVVDQLFPNEANDHPLRLAEYLSGRSNHQMNRVQKELALRVTYLGCLIISLFFIVGCASVSVQSQQEKATWRFKKPQVLIVKDYGFPNQATVRADRSGNELAAFEQNLQVILRNQLVRALGQYGLPITVANTSQELRKLRTPQPAWLITGQFTRVNQGSRALRVALGLGAGGTKMETVTQVYDLSSRSRQQALFTFSTTGGSNAEPGMITSVGPLAPTTVPVLVISMAAKGMHGVSEDAKRTARVIAAHVSEQLATRGYLPADKRPGHAKVPGEL
jgi:hypothetical protein